MIRKSANHRHRSALWLRIRTIRSLKQIHALTIVAPSPTSLRELLYSAAITIPTAICYAHKVFDGILHPDLFMWNTIIRASAHGPAPSDALSLFSRMGAHANVRPDVHTFVFLLKACSRLSLPATGCQLHASVVKIGLADVGFVRNALINFNANCGDLKVADALFNGMARSDVVAWSAMIAGYARRGQLGSARKLFDEMPIKDLISCNVMITGYMKMGKMDSAHELFDRVPGKDVVSWNAMIAGYAKCGMYEKALGLFEEMRETGVRPDQVTMLSLLFACADSSSLEIGERIHSSLLDLFSEDGDMNLFHGNKLIDMYSKCGSIERALYVFQGMRERDISTWNTIIGGLAFHGHAMECVKQFSDMLIQGVSPNEITFVGVLIACSHGGMVEEGRKYYSLMIKKYGIKPNVKHYGCMVDMLGRAGLLDEAFRFVLGMDIEPNPVVWRSLLGACRLHGNIELAKLANEQLLKMDQGASGDYILLSNIYASVCEWNGAQKMREIMDDRGVPKEAGCSIVGGDNNRRVCPMVIA